MDNNYFKITFLIFLFAWVPPLIYGKYRCNNPNFEDPLDLRFAFWDFDAWSLVHFGVCVVGGYFFPNYLYLMFFWGVIWEIFEYYYGKYQPDFLEGLGNCFLTDKVWWYGKTSDIFVNLIGLMVGYYISIYLVKNSLKKNYSLLFCMCYGLVAFGLIALLLVKHKAVKAYFSAILN